MNRFICPSLVIAAIVVAPALAIGLRPQPASACTGGGGAFDESARSAPMIVIVEAVEVGDATNRAPTVTPTATPTVTATTPAGTATTPPTPADAPLPTAAPVALDLAGIGATFRLVQSLAGPAPSRIELFWSDRARIEQELRQIEAGVPVIISCALDAFIPRIAAGARYLLFLGVEREPLFLRAILRVDGDEVVLNDAALLAANQGALIMNPATYRTYFSGVLADVNDEFAFIKAPSVPPAMVLRAIEGLRGVPITPPVTGSAGLKDRGG